MTTILSDTSLCAIVRDEKENPAGGIQRWLHAILPHVEQAVVVDTGSIDGTREALEEMQLKYRHLRVYDHAWKGFPNARNRSLREVKTKWALVLDADELVADENKSVEGGFRNLREIRNSRNKRIYSMMMRNVFLDGKEYLCGSGIGPRFFVTKDMECVGFGNCDHWESFTRKKGGHWRGYPLLDSQVNIPHFRVSEKARDLKQTLWYVSSLYLDNSPSVVGKRQGWKEYNPQRDLWSEGK